MAKHWIKSAVAGAHGQFRRAAESAGKTTREFADEKADAPGKLGKEARLAKVLMGMHHVDGGLVDKAARLYSKKAVARKGFAKGGKVAATWDEQDDAVARMMAEQSRLEDKENQRINDEETKRKGPQTRGKSDGDGYAKGGKVTKHRFVKHKKPEQRGAPMRAEEAANTAGDPQQPAPMPMPAQGAAPVAAPAAAIPAQATGGAVRKVAPMSRATRLYGSKKVMRA